MSVAVVCVLTCQDDILLTNMKTSLESQLLSLSFSRALEFNQITSWKIIISPTLQPENAELISAFFRQRICLSQWSRDQSW